MTTGRINQVASRFIVRQNDTRIDCRLNSKGEHPIAKAVAVYVLCPILSLSLSLRLTTAA